MLSFQHCFAMWSFFFPPPLIFLDRNPFLFLRHVHLKCWTQNKPPPSGHQRWWFLDGKKLDQNVAGVLVRGEGRWWAGAGQLEDGCWGMNQWISIPECPWSWPKPQRNDCAITLCGLGFFFFFLLFFLAFIFCIRATLRLMLCGHCCSLLGLSLFVLCIHPQPALLHLPKVWVCTSHSIEVQRLPGLPWSSPQFAHLGQLTITDHL